MAATYELGRRPLPATARRPYRFALWAALVMLALNLIGFAPTLYLRAFFDVPTIPCVSTTCAGCIRRP